MGALKILIISTHSPRVGRTILVSLALAKMTHFNSLAPCGANRIVIDRYIDRSAISTHSPRVGRTPKRSIAFCMDIYFNSLAPCGANRKRRANWKTYTEFQLTRPVWGEPLPEMDPTLNDDISTHSPRVGRTPGRG